MNFGFDTLAEAKSNIPSTKHPSGYPIKDLVTISGLLVVHRIMKTSDHNYGYYLSVGMILW